MKSRKSVLNKNETENELISKELKDNLKTKSTNRAKNDSLIRENYKCTKSNKELKSTTRESYALKEKKEKSSGKKEKKEKKAMTEAHIKKECSVTDKDLARILEISKTTALPERTYINSLFNLKAYVNHLKEDYREVDITEYFISQLKDYKHKIHFMQKQAKYKTDFYNLVSEFEDTHIQKWKNESYIGTSSYLKPSDKSGYIESPNISPSGYSYCQKTNGEKSAGSVFADLISEISEASGYGTVPRIS